MEDKIKGKIIYWIWGRRNILDFKEGWISIAGDIAVHLQVKASTKGSRIMVNVHTHGEILIEELYLTLPQPIATDDKIFLNGYQSWTESRLYQPDERIPNLRVPFPHLVNTTGDYTFYKNPNKSGYLHAWSFTSLQSSTDGTTFWMDTAPETGYTLFEWQCPDNQLIIRKEVGGRRLQGKTEALMLHVDIWKEEGTEVTLPQFPGFSARPVTAPATGWTSWYNYYTKIDEQIILDNLRAFGFREIPIDFFQIDDGWQPAVGDWLEANEKFPLGMAHIADQVHRYGYKAGLWLAPLIVAKDSSIYHVHRDWLLTHDGEHLVEAGYNPGWGGLFNGTYYVLNLELPEVKTHLRTVFDRILGEWGYDLVKLDFLFAAGLIPHDGKSRGQCMHEAFAFLRECCGDKLILGCGVPLAATWGKADYCRIGPDIGLEWELKVGKSIHLRETISTHTALHNTINRRHFSGRLFANDPDVFILRKANNDLSPQQKHSLLVINQIFGDLLFTSDDIGGYDAATMRLYRSTFPALAKKVTKVEVKGDVYHIFFQVADRHYFVAANLGRLDQKIHLPELYFYRIGEGFVEGESSIYLKPFETGVYLIRPTDELGVVASDLHLYPGCEVTKLKPVENGIHVALHPQISVSGTLVLCVGCQGETIEVNGQNKPIRPKDNLRLVILDVKDGKFA